MIAMSLQKREVEAGGGSEATSVQVPNEQAALHVDAGRADVRSVRSLPRAETVAWCVPGVRLLSGSAHSRDQAGRRVRLVSCPQPRAQQCRRASRPVRSRAGRRGRRPGAGGDGARRAGGRPGAGRARHPGRRRTGHPAGRGRPGAARRGHRGPLAGHRGHGRRSGASGAAKTEFFHCGRRRAWCAREKPTRSSAPGTPARRWRPAFFISGACRAWSGRPSRRPCPPRTVFVSSSTPAPTRRCGRNICISSRTWARCTSGKCSA